MRRTDQTARKAERSNLANEVAPRVAAEIARLRIVPYSDLAALVARKDLFDEITSVAGHTVVLETTVLWDDRRRRHVRVIVDVWWPGEPRRVKSSLASSSFIIAPDGAFIGEDGAE